MPTLREIQLATLDILKEVIKVCERHNLTYYLSGGTLLGAVRHSGFIPWDDDLDIELPWEDYQKFIRYAKKELPEDLFVQTFYSDPGYPNIFMMVRKNGTSALPVAAKELDIHWGIEVDVFPIIGLYKNEKLKNYQRKKMRHISKILLIEYKKCLASEDLKTDPVYIKYSRYSLKRRILLCRVLLFLLTKSISPKEVATTPFGMPHVFNAKDYERSVKLPFEDLQLNAPAGYHNILTTLYGDYMTPPPESERGGHDLLMGDIIWDLHQDYSQFK